MKKFLSVILGLTLLFSLVGCGSMNKEVLTTESFQTYFEGKEDYKVFDITYQCEGQNMGGQPNGMGGQQGGLGGLGNILGGIINS